MRISDLIAAAAFIVAIAAALLLNRQKKRLAGPPQLGTSVQITSGKDKNPGGGEVADEPVPPAYKGTFTVTQGTAQLDSAHFLVRRKSDGDYTEIHSFAAVFDPPRERPIVERAHVIHAKPLNAARFHESLDGAEAVLVEFRDVSGRVFRSPELAVR